MTVTQRCWSHISRTNVNDKQLNPYNRPYIHNEDKQGFYIDIDLFTCDNDIKDILIFRSNSYLMRVGQNNKKGIKHMKISSHSRIIVTYEFFSQQKTLIIRDFNVFSLHA